MGAPSPPRAMRYASAAPAVAAATPPPPAAEPSPVDLVGGASQQPPPLPAPSAAGGGGADGIGAVSGVIGHATASAQGEDRGVDPYTGRMKRVKDRLAARDPAHSHWRRSGKRAHQATSSRWSRWARRPKP